MACAIDPTLYSIIQITCEMRARAVDFKYFICMAKFDRCFGVYIVPAWANSRFS